MKKAHGVHRTGVFNMDIKCSQDSVAPVTVTAAHCAARSSENIAAPTRKRNMRVDKKRIPCPYNPSQYAPITCALSGYPANVLSGVPVWIGSSALATRRQWAVHHRSANDITETMEYQILNKVD
jgi:hypothetical protein